MTATTSEVQQARSAQTFSCFILVVNILLRYGTKLRGDQPSRNTR